MDTSNVCILRIHKYPLKRHLELGAHVQLLLSSLARPNQRGELGKEL